MFRTLLVPNNFENAPQCNSLHSVRRFIKENTWHVWAREDAELHRHTAVCALLHAPRTSLFAHMRTDAITKKKNNNSNSTWEFHLSSADVASMWGSNHSSPPPFFFITSCIFRHPRTDSAFFFPFKHREVKAAWALVRENATSSPSGAIRFSLRGKTDFKTVSAEEVLPV